MPALLRNLRFALRLLGKNPGFTLATILTLALGIGANTAIFTVTSALLLRPFPYRDPEQLVTVRVSDQTKERPTTLLRYELVRDNSRTFESVGVWANDNLNLTGSGEPLQVPVLQEALAAARGIKAEWTRALALTRLAPHLAEPLQVTVLQDRKSVV